MSSTSTQARFIEFALAQGILQFGEFKLKSGRTSPYFFNLGAVSSASALKALGDFYAQTIQEQILTQNRSFDVLLGAAYKGIPLSVATSLSMLQCYGQDIRYAFNRKETKSHGEGGIFVGAPIEGDILLIDDVLTAGTAIQSLLQLLAQTPAKVVGLVICFDRTELVDGKSITAAQNVAETYNIPIYAIATFQDLIDCATQKSLLSTHQLEKIHKYRKSFGINAH